ncbi:MAG: aldo/keto reductase [Christensenellales bacterium]
MDLVKYAIETGYTSIDTAAAYENEEFVGQGIRESGAKREDLFITTKLRNRYHGYDTTLFAFDESMKKLGLETLDLYLIHWPGEDMYLPTWKAFVRLYEEKRIRAIGVSNFYPQHIDVLYGNRRNAGGGQIETHPYLHQNVVIDYCRSIISGRSVNPLMVGGEVLKDPSRPLRKSMENLRRRRFCAGIRKTALYLSQ